MTTLTPSRLAEIEALVPWLRNMAEAGAKALNFMAASKTTRNRAAGDLNSDYGIMTPQQTQEWKAAEAIYELLASHAALAAEVKRLRLELADLRFQNSDLVRDKGLILCDVGRRDYEIETLRKQLTTARESAAREMRERCAAWLHESDVTLFMGREVADGAKYRKWLVKAISALPLTPADGAKDE